MDMMMQGIDYLDGT